MSPTTLPVPGAGLPACPGRRRPLRRRRRRRRTAGHVRRVTVTPWVVTFRHVTLPPAKITPREPATVTRAAPNWLNSPQLTPLGRRRRRAAGTEGSVCRRRVGADGVLRGLLCAGGSVAGCPVVSVLAAGRPSAVARLLQCAVRNFEGFIRPRGLSSRPVDGKGRWREEERLSRVCF